MPGPPDFVSIRKNIILAFALTVVGAGVGEWLFHAGTKNTRGALLTNGGRVLTATATGASLSEAQQRSSALAARVQFDGAFFRRDIGWRALQRGA